MPQFSVVESPITTELTTMIDEGFRLYGIDATGFDIPLERVAFIAYDGEIFAGAVTAHVLWGTLHIRNMFIDAAYRRQGLGTTLMTKTLDYGKEHGCTVAFVDTMSFQALGFYLKLGFIHEFTRSGFAHNTVLYYLKKSLSQKKVPA
jgi:GNAT superfamily N-acetyltransferase